MSTQVGTIHDTKSLLVCLHAGEAKYKEQTFELANSMAGSPIVFHPDGRKYSLSWKEVMSLAIDAFNDDDDSLLNKDSKAKSGMQEALNDACGK